MIAWDTLYVVMYVNKDTYQEIHFHDHTNQIMKGQVQSPLMNNTCILQSKCHQNPLKDTNKHETSHFGHVLFGHKNLIVAGVYHQEKTGNDVLKYH